MGHLECPRKELWAERQAWFEKVEEEMRGEAGYMVSEQACALTADVQAVFCAGAWVAVIVLAVAVVDAALRETEVPNYKGSRKNLIDVAGANSKLQEMRKRGNAFLHVNPDNPAITVDHQWFERDRLEKEGKQSVRLMFEAFYIAPCV